MKHQRKFTCIITLLLLSAFANCSKSKYLYRHSGVWEVSSMQIDYLNSSGGIDSTVSNNITGMIMFYNTPTTGDDPFYLASIAFTVKGREHHSSYFYRSDGNIITMVMNIGQLTPERAYDLSKNSRNSMTLDYTGQANNVYGYYYGKIREHIVLKRIKF